MSDTPKHIIPRVTPEAKEYFDGAVRGELRIQRCTTCRLHQHYPRSMCWHCGADTLEWVTASGRGTVHSFTVIRQHGVPLNPRGTTERQGGQLASLKSLASHLGPGVDPGPLFTSVTSPQPRMPQRIVCIGLASPDPMCAATPLNPALGPRACGG